MATTTKRLSYDEAADRLMQAGTAISTLTDEQVPPRLSRAVRILDAIVGQSMANLGDAKSRGMNPDLAVAQVTGAVRVAAASLPSLEAMPEARPYRSAVEMLREAFDAFAPRRAA